MAALTLHETCTSPDTNAELLAGAGRYAPAWRKVAWMPAAVTTGSHASSQRWTTIVKSLPFELTLLLFDVP